MKTIPLTRGKVAIVDDEDYAVLSAWKWYAINTNNSWYAMRTDMASRRNIRMHRQIMAIDSQIDHRNGNGLDNRRCNLRPCTSAQNSYNRGLHKRNKSGFIGVFWSNNAQRWEAQIRHRGKRMYLGRFDTATEAAMVRDLYAVRFHGDFAKLNFGGFNADE
jgi:hypothetical protein